MDKSTPVFIHCYASEALLDAWHGDTELATGIELPLIYVDGMLEAWLGTDLTDWVSGYIKRVPAQRVKLVREDGKEWDAVLLLAKGKCRTIGFIRNKVDAEGWQRLMRFAKESGW